MQKGKRPQSPYNQGRTASQSSAISPRHSICWPAHVSSETQIYQLTQEGLEASANMKQKKKKKKKTVPLDRADSGRHRGDKNFKDIRNTSCAGNVDWGTYDSQRGAFSITLSGHCWLGKCGG
jgi:hypothetical protein